MTYRVRSKSFQLHPKRIAIAEYFCCCNTLSLLIKQEKLIQIFLFYQKSHTKMFCYGSFFWVRFKIFKTTFCDGHSKRS